MKKFASFLAAATIMFTGAGGLAADVHAAAMSAPRATVSTVSASSSSSGSTLYQELLKKGYIVTGNSNKKETTSMKQVVKSTKASKKNKKSNSSLYEELIRNGGYIVDDTDDTEPSNDNTDSSNSSTSTSKNNVQMTDYYGNKLSSSMYVSYNGLTANQQYIYNTVKAAADKGSTVAKLKRGYSSNDISTACNALQSDCSYMVWVKGYVNSSRDKNGRYTSVKIVYDTTLNKDRAATMQRMNDYLKPMLDKASKLSTDVEKVKYVHDWLIYSVKDGSAKANDMYYHKAYAAIVDKKGVCEAYSEAFVYCMQKLGIQSAVISGTTWNGVGHAWNIVKVGGDWYEVDVYWDDLITKSETDYTYTCFMQTTASLKEYDSYNGVSRKRYSICNYLPIAYGTKYSPSNYRYSNGTNFRNLPKVVITKNKK